MTEPCFSYQKLTKDEHQSIKSLWRGDATEIQQKQALSVIVKKLAITHDQPFVINSADQTSFRCGRKFVGEAILKYINSPIRENEDD